MIDKKTRIQLIVPTRAQVRAELSIFREWLLMHELGRGRYELVLGYSDAQPVANNLNRIALRVLEDEETDYWLKIDSDTVPGCNPLDYVERDLDVLGFPCATWRANDDEPLIWFPAPPDGRGLVEVEGKGVGGGVLLIARRVLEHPAMRAPFLDEWDEDGLRTVPEDTTFCTRAMAAGFRVWCDMSKPMYHFKGAELLTLWNWVQREIVGRRKQPEPTYVARVLERGVTDGE